MSPRLPATLKGVIQACAPGVGISGPLKTLPPSGTEPPIGGHGYEEAFLHLLFSRGSTTGQWHQSHRRLHLPGPPLCADSQTHPGRLVRTAGRCCCSPALRALLQGEREVGRARIG